MIGRLANSYVLLTHISASVLVLNGIQVILLWLPAVVGKDRLSFGKEDDFLVNIIFKIYTK
jgi:hypothetical protein